jgi:hypothetical protein
MQSFALILCYGSLDKNIARVFAISDINIMIEKIYSKKSAYTLNPFWTPILFIYYPNFGKKDLIT